MATFLHLVKRDAAALAGAVIESNLREAGARVTVVLLDTAAAPPLPAAVAVRRLAPGDLDYPGLLDLIFAHDHVITW
jgi:hypothetical protein